MKKNILVSLFLLILLGGVGFSLKSFAAFSQPGTTTTTTTTTAATPTQTPTPTPTPTLIGDCSTLPEQPCCTYTGPPGSCEGTVINISGWTIQCCCTGTPPPPPPPCKCPADSSLGLPEGDPDDCSCGNSSVPANYRYKCECEENDNGGCVCVWKNDISCIAPKTCNGGKCKRPDGTLVIPDPDCP